MSAIGASGAALIAAERQRQIEAEGYTPEHDDEHDDGSLAIAAACYAASAACTSIYVRNDYANSIHFSDPWPWERRYDARPYGRLLTEEERTGRESDTRMGSNVLADDATEDEALRLLVKAGALIAAEIDRLQRKARR